jgi:hypothetical protein
VAETAVLPKMANPSQSPTVDYSEDGVDLTLIRWMLSLTVAERLQFLQKQVNAILAIRSIT